MTPDTWMSVTIIMDTYIQLYMHMHMTAEVASSWSSTSTNNKVTLVKAMASSFTNVYIYASSPFSGETAATAKMRYLKITSPDSLPASFYPSSSYTNNNGGGIYKGNLVGMVVLPKAYTISFEFYPTASNANGEFLLSLTAKGWTTGLVAGQRLPAVQVCGSSGWGTCPAGNLYVVFNSWGSGNADYYYYSTESKVPPLSTWTTVTIFVDAENGVFHYTMSGGVSAVIGPGQFNSYANRETSWPAVAVWATHTADTPASGVLRNLAITAPTDVTSSSVTFYPSASPTYASGYTLPATATATALGTLSLPEGYVVQFDMMATSVGSSYRTILLLSAIGKDQTSTKGSRLPIVQFTDCSGFMCLTAQHLGSTADAALTSGSKIILTDSLTLSKWYTVVTTVDKTSQAFSIYVYDTSTSVKATAGTVALTSQDIKTWLNVAVMAGGQGSDPCASMRDLKIYDTPELPASYYPSSTPTYASGVATATNGLLGLVSLPSAYVIKFDIYSTLSTRTTSWLSPFGLSTTGYLSGACATDGTNSMGYRMPVFQFKDTTTILTAFLYASTSQPLCGTGVYSHSPASDRSATANSLTVNTWYTVTMVVDIGGTTEGYGSYFALSITSATGSLLSSRSEYLGTGWSATGGSSGNRVNFSPRTSWLNTYVWAGPGTDPGNVKLRDVSISAPSALPFSAYPSSSSTYANGIALTQGAMLGTVALPAAYSVSIDLMPTSAGSSYRAVLTLCASGNNCGYDNSAGCAVPALVFHPNNGGNGVYINHYASRSDYSTSTDAGTQIFGTSTGTVSGTFLQLPTSSWTTLTITVDRNLGVLGLTATGGVTYSKRKTFTVATQKTFNSAVVYAGPWWDAVFNNGVARNVAIAPISSLPVTYYPSATNPTGATLPAVASTFLQGLVSLPSAFVVTFDIYLNTNSAASSAVVHVSGDGQFSSTAGSSWPAVWMTGSSTGPSGASCESNCGKLWLQVVPVSGTKIELYSASALPTATWVTVTIVLDAGRKMMALSSTAFSATTVSWTATNTYSLFPAAQVWSPSAGASSDTGASAVASAKLRDLAFSVPASLPVSYFPTSTGTALTASTLVGFVQLPTQYTISFDLMPTGQASTTAISPSILRVTTSGSSSSSNDGSGPALPSVAFRSYADTASSSYYSLEVVYPKVTTTTQKIQPAEALSLNVWTTITITLDTLNLLMTVSASGGATIPATTLALGSDTVQTGWDSAAIYASDVYSSAAVANMRYLTFITGFSASPTTAPTAAPTTAPTAKPTVVPTAKPTAVPTAPTANPTPQPTAPTANPTPQPTRPTAVPTRMTHSTSAQFVYTTFHHGAQCRSKPFGYNIRPYRLNECITENGENYKLACYVGPNKSTIVKRTYSDQLCQAQTSSSIITHEETCKKLAGTGMAYSSYGGLYTPLAHSLTRCDAALPVELTSRDQLLVDSFAIAGGIAVPKGNALMGSLTPTATPTTVYAWGGIAGKGETMATLLGQCTEVTELSKVVSHRRVTFVSGDGIVSDIVLRVVFFSAKDRCSGDSPVLSDKRVVYAIKSAVTASPSGCLPDPLYAGRCYKTAIRTLNTQTDSAVTSQLPRLVFKPTSSPTVKPTAPTPVPT